MYQIVRQRKDVEGVRIHIPYCLTVAALTVAAASRHSPTYIPEAVTHTHQQLDQDHVILATALVLVKDSSGCYRLGRALLDSCSQINFITDQFTQTLRIPRTKRIVKTRSIGDSPTQVKHGTTTSIKSRFKDFELTIDFCVTPSIAHHPNTEIYISSWSLPQSTSLPDEYI